MTESDGRLEAPVERALRIAWWTGLVGIAALILFLPYLPFQDVPQQIRMLAQQRLLPPGARTAFFQARTEQVFSYALYGWIDTVLAPLLPPSASLRVLSLLAFALLPLSVWRLARAAGGCPPLAALLALPLGLSAHFLLGLIPFTLGLACALLACGASLDLCKRFRLAKALELALWLALAYTNHPIPVLQAFLMVALVWLHRGVQTPYATAGIVAAAVPALLMGIHDVTIGAFSNVAGAEVGWPVPKLQQQGLTDIFHGFFVMSYGITGVRALLCALPLLAVTTLCVVLALGHDGQTPERRQSRSILRWIAIVMTGLLVLTPLSIGTTFRLSSRFPMIAVLALVVIGSFCATRLTRRGALAIGAAVLLALGSTGLDMVGDALAIQSLVGTGPRHPAGGSLAVVRFPDCAGETRAGSRWLTYDPFWHIWAYVVDLDAAVAQAFAFSRYHRIQFRPERYPELVVAPDHEALQSGSPWHRCDDNALYRLLWALGSPGHPGGVLLIMPPDKVRLALKSAPVRTRQVAPGFLLVQHDPRRPERTTSSALLTR